MGATGFDVCVSGSGAVAMSLALSLSAQGWKVAWAGTPPSARSGPPEVRTYALNARSIALLQRLRVWPALQRWATPVWDMAIQGDQGGQLQFSAWQQRVSELAWIVDAAALEGLLGDALRFAPGVEIVPLISGPGPSVPAPLLAVCEGKYSNTREMLGIEFDRRDYGHCGVATRLQASVPHHGVARQWFRSPDVLALLPFHDPEPGASYGLVWSVPTARAAELTALSPEAFAAELQAALAQSEPNAAALVGELRVTAPVVAWPLALAEAQRWSGPGWVLLGDAAHQVHPLAGQGLNLGLADVETLVEVLGEARQREPWRQPGDERVLARYVRRRAWPTRSMAGLTDGLLHLFADQRGPVRELRNVGMSMVQRMGPLKHWLVGRALDS